MFIRYSLVTAFVVFLIAVIMIFPLRAIQVDLKKEHLLIEAGNLAAVLGDYFAEGSQDTIMTVINSGSISPEERITVIGTDGEVLGDSAADPSAMKNHAERPEVAAALRGEQAVATRLSATIGKEYLYAAAPIIIDGDIAGVVRVSVERGSIVPAITPAWLTMVAGLGFLLLLLFIVTFWTEKTLAADLREISGGLEKMVVSNDLDRMPQPRLSELQELAQNLDTIAERARTNYALVESERDKLEAILVNINTGVMVTGADGRIVLINRVAQDILGLGGKDISGKRPLEVYSMPALESAIERSGTGVDVSEEVRITVPRKRTVIIKTSAIKGEGEEISGVVCVLEDVTATRRLERVRRDFVANVSHELRTPVANLRAVMDALGEGAINDEDRAVKFLSSMDRESARLMGLIEDLLVLSRLESEEFIMSREVFDLSKLLDEVIEEKTELAGRHSVKVESLSSGNSVSVSADRKLVRVACANLIDNAIKYNRSGGTVTVESFRDGLSGIVRVGDTGIGIPRGESRRIFERFYRVDRARSRETGGTGLGLSIVKHVAELHAGKVFLEESGNDGSSFRLEIPLG